jgi:hypothetical protein
MNRPLVEAAVRLADVLARENAALAALDLSRAAAMLAEKQDAASVFALAWERAHPAGANGVEILSLARRLDTAVAENRRLLERGIAVQGRVLAVVARAVPSALAAEAPRYGAGGRQPAPPRAPLALSLRA